MLWHSEHHKKKADGRDINYTCICNSKSSRLLYTMRQKFSNFFNPIFVMFKYAHVCDMRLIDRVLHNFTFHDNFSHFSDVYGLPRDVEEIRQITCFAFHVHPMSSKFALTDSYMYLNK